MLQHAEASLRESGAEELSLRGLARDLGVSHAAPNRHFKDKQALLDALAVRGFARLGEEFGATRAASAVEHMQELACRYLRFAIGNPALLHVMFSRKHSPTAGEQVAEAAYRAFAEPLAAIAAAQERGELPPGDPTHIGLSFLATMQGAASLACSGFISETTAEAIAKEGAIRSIGEPGPAQPAERARSDDTAAPSR